MATLSFREVSKSYGSTLAVRRLSLEVEDGEFLVILGPSGCGKTTAMRMVAGLESISEGEIRIDDRIVNDLPPRFRDVAMVFQSYALYPHMTVLRNIEYPLRLRKVEPDERRRQAEAAATQVGLGELLERFPRELSGGEQQRVALARAIVRSPAVFLLDEPLSNLDAKLRGRMRAEIKRLQRGLGVTTIYVTHDQVEAMTLADRIAVMRDGVLQQLAPPRDIYDDPVNRFVAGFIGSPAMSFLPGRLEGGVFEGAGARVSIPIPGNSGEVSVGLRAEDLEIVAEHEADLVGPIYSSEMIGDATHVFVQIADELVAVREAKNFAGEIGGTVGVRIDPSKAFVFDASSGDRIRPSTGSTD